MNIKKIISIMVVLTLTLMTNSIVFAEETCNIHNEKMGCCEFHCEDSDEYVVLSDKPQITVEVSSEEEMENYPRDPQYRYKFIIPEPVKARAVCYMCGKSTMSTAKVKEEQISIVARCCPLNQWGVLDHFITDDNYRVERCTSCGYEAKIEELGYTYRAICRNTDIPDEQEWEVREEWHMSDGYDIHQVYDYWVYGTMS